MPGAQAKLTAATPRLRTFLIPGILSSSSKGRDAKASPNPHLPSRTGHGNIPSKIQGQLLPEACLAGELSQLLECWSYQRSFRDDSSTFHILASLLHTGAQCQPEVGIQCPNALGNVASGLPFCACKNHNSQISLISFLIFFFNTAAPLLFLIPFFPMALNHGGLSPGCHIWEFSCPGDGAPSRLQGKFSCGSKGLVTPARLQRGARSPQQ